MTNSPRSNEDRDDGPWYRQFWAWFVLAPLLLVILVWIPFMTIAIKQSDDVVVDSYYKEGRMYNQRLDQDLLARQLGLQGELFLDLEVGEIVLTLGSRDAAYTLPAQLELHLDHPLEADNDLTISLRQVYPGRYLGELSHAIQHRWYVRLTPQIASSDSPPAAATTQSDWRITGELDLSQSNRMQIGVDE